MFPLMAQDPVIAETNPFHTALPPLPSLVSPEKARIVEDDGNHPSNELPERRL